MWILNILITLAWVVGTGYLAKKKGLNVILWGAIGGMFFALGLLLCLTYSFYVDYRRNNGAKAFGFTILGKRA
ncbi:hypothetical protein [uncultured Clostridium sp.]|jgi:RsiW-degrading membrane proteinase PrsW (M82 family)|uniref:hypothetical protein n=1 Tax=uncultured Clostridium sp. TaxID=59620 RepID=UPI00262FCEDB|nr:hypothetical protein [uncultured Clostridium sp.]